MKKQNEPLELTIEPIRVKNIQLEFNKIPRHTKVQKCERNFENPTESAQVTAAYNSDLGKRCLRSIKSSSENHKGKGKD
jgi:hypothetical protein